MTVSNLPETIDTPIPHPADERVLVTDNLNHLSAGMRKGIKGLVVRDIRPDILKELDDASNIIKLRFLNQMRNSMHMSGTYFKADANADKYVQAAVELLNKLGNAFYNATYHDAEIRNNSAPNPHQYDTLRSWHLDSGVELIMTFILFNKGTMWLSGDIELTDEQLKALDQRMGLPANTNIAHEGSIQVLQPGDVLFARQGRGTHVSDRLIHRSYCNAEPRASFAFASPEM